MLESYTLTILDTPVTVYAMPYKQRSLAEVVGTKSFGLQREDYPRTKRWVREVLSGLKYLHSRGLCHLNVTVDNVVFTSKFRAQLCDFDSLKEVEDSIDRTSVGLPWWFLPPESELSGRETDLWSFGLLVIDCLTKLTVANGDPTPERSWELEVFPRMRQVLQVPEFSRLVRRAFPASDIPDKELLKGSDFVHGFLHTDPEMRTPAARAKEHAFLGGKKRNATPDSVWDSPVQQATPDAAVLGEDAEPTSLEATASDKPIGQASTYDVIILEDCPEQTPTPNVTPDEPEPVSGAPQFSDHELDQLVKCVNRLIKKAIEEFRYKDLKGPDAADVEESSQSSVDDSNVEVQESLQTPVEDSKADVQEPSKDCVKPDHEDALIPKPKEKVLDSEPEAQGTSGSVEREQYSYFNLRSLELSSRFDSSKNEAGSEQRVSFKALRRTLSRAANFFAKRK